MRNKRIRQKNSSLSIDAKRFLHRQEIKRRDSLREMKQVFDHWTVKRELYLYEKFVW